MSSVNWSAGDMPVTMGACAVIEPMSQPMQWVRDIYLCVLPATHACMCGETIHTMAVQHRYGRQDGSTAS